MGRPVLRMFDLHIGHISKTPPLPWHATPFVPIVPSTMSLNTITQAAATVSNVIGLLGDGKVFVNKRLAVKNGDMTFCTDVAARIGGSVYVNSKLIFRVGDTTLGFNPLLTGDKADAHKTYLPSVGAPIVGKPTVFAG